MSEQKTKRWASVGAKNRKRERECELSACPCLFSSLFRQRSLDLIKVGFFGVFGSTLVLILARRWRKTNLATRKKRVRERERDALFPGR